MSPTVNNFVHDLVAMAKAMEDLPRVQEELEQARRTIEQQAFVIQNRELSILSRDAEIDNLNHKVRTAEEARDQAELMFLECDDKRVALSRVVESFTGNVSALLKAQEPPAPPAPEPAPEAIQPVEAVDNPQTVPATLTVDPFVNEAKPAEPIGDVYHDYDPPPASWATPTAPEVAPTTPPGAEPSATPSDVPSAHAPNEGVTSTGQAVGVDKGQSEAGPTYASTTEAVHSPVDASAASGTGAVQKLEPTYPEPERYHTDTKEIRSAWWNWYDSQSADFRAAYVW